MKEIIWVPTPNHQRAELVSMYLFNLKKLIMPSFHQKTDNESVGYMVLSLPFKKRSTEWMGLSHEVIL